MDNMLVLDANMAAISKCFVIPTCCDVTHLLTMDCLAHLVDYHVRDDRFIPLVDQQSGS